MKDAQEHLHPVKKLALRLDDASVERRRAFVGLEPDDIGRITKLRPIIEAHIDDLAETFFQYLARLPEADALLDNKPALEEVRDLKREHLRAMVGGEYGAGYVEQRTRMALVYSRVNLDPRVFLGAFHHLMHQVGERVMRAHLDSPLEAFGAFMSLKKVAFFDVGIIVDILIHERERIIRQQQEAIRELSTPVLQLRDRLLLLPLVGVVDSLRARQLTDELLRAIRARRAKVVVMDITGTAAVDSKVANHLIQTISAARLMGSQVIVTGISADVAQALVTLGVDFGSFRTVGDLQGGIEEAERLLGLHTAPVSPAAAGSETAGGAES